MRLASSAMLFPSVPVPALPHKNALTFGKRQGNYLEIERNYGLYPEEFFDPANLQGKRVLDLGTFDGHMVADLRQGGIDAYGIDLRFVNPKEGAGKKLAQANALHLPFADNTFDVIYSNYSLFTYRGFHNPEVDAPAQENKRPAMREIERVLKPGGKLRISPVDVNEIQRILDEIASPALQITQYGEVSSQKEVTLKWQKDFGWDDHRYYWVELMKTDQPDEGGFSLQA